MTQQQLKPQMPQQPQQMTQPPPAEVYERRESYSDGEYDQSGSDSDGFCGPHESPQAKAAFKNFLRQFKRKEKVTTPAISHMRTHSRTRTRTHS
jgi:hypothetical protein